jgi:glycerol-3-phosphate dehydrogenase
VNEKGSESTASLSRDHTILVSPAGLVTIAGGKWTTYRKMAEDCVDRAAMVAQGPRRPCVTRELRIHGYHANPEELGKLAIFGSDAEEVRAIIASDPDLDALLHERLPARLHDVVHAARFEMARTLEDVLSRRTRSLLLDARAAVEAAPRAATLLARELGRDTAWEKAQVEAFATLARGYVVEG